VPCTTGRRRPGRSHRVAATRQAGRRVEAARRSRRPGAGGAL